MTEKEMNGLIFCNVKPYTIEVDGKTETVRGEKWVGYFGEDGLFHASCFNYENGQWWGEETLTVSMEEFNASVEMSWVLCEENEEDNF